MKASAPGLSAITVGTGLQKLLRDLASTSPTPRVDAEALVMHACEIDRGGLITRAETALTDAQQMKLRGLLERRRRGEPIAYLTGVREFWSLELRVTPATLIPRPETELLVEKALARIPIDAAWTLADLGTGSGAIALALARERPRCRIIATDISPAAHEVAKANARALAVTNVEFRTGDWFTPLEGETFNMLVSNPPYVCAHDPHLQRGDVRFEPLTALVAGADGLDALRQIARHAMPYLKPGGWLLLEHGWNQAASVIEMLQRQGYRDMVSHRDPAGHARLAECRR